MIYHLKKGATLICTNESCAKTATIYFIFRIGSRDESPSYAGMAHFVEHMLFKGTCNRPEAKLITQQIDKYGGLFNAFTSYDMTGYYIKLPAKHLPAAIEILSDMILNSIFDEREIKPEQEVVINELKMREADPANKLDNLVNKLIFKDTTLANEIGGSRKTVCKFDRQMVLNFVSHYYKDKNMIISIAGKVPIKSTIKLLNEKFILPISNRYRSLTTIHSPLKRNPRYHDHYLKQKRMRYSCKQVKGLDHTFISFGFPVIKYGSTISWVIDIIGSILAGGMNSRLFQELREDKGLVYSVAYNTDLLEDTGDLTIECSTFNNPKSISAVIDTICQAIKTLKSTPPPSSELERVITSAINSLDMKSENTKEQALTQALEYIYTGKVYTRKELTKIYNRITPEAVQQTAKLFLKKDKLNLGIVSPLRVKQPKILI